MLVTSGTVTSAKIMEQRLPKGAIHQFVPLDIPRAVTRFLDHWKPDAALFVESDLWPNLVLAAASARHDGWRWSMRGSRNIRRAAGNARPNRRGG